MYCVTSEGPQLIDQHLLCDPKQQFAMASAEEKWKDETKDRQVMGSNANGAEGAEGKTGETNLSGKDPKGPSRKIDTLELKVP
jgi:hypothetical protein